MLSTVGPVLTITRACDCAKVAAWLKESNDSRPNSKKELMIRGIRVDQKASSTLLELLRCNQRAWESMEILNCEGRVEEAMSSAIAHDKVKQMRIVNLEMGLKGFVALGEALGANSSLTFFGLTIRLLRGEAVEAMINGLKNNKALETMDFKWSKFNNDGVIELAKGLCKTRGFFFSEK
jgi:hypothetical protein